MTRRMKWSAKRILANLGDLRAEIAAWVRCGPHLPNGPGHNTTEAEYMADRIASWPAASPVTPRLTLEDLTAILGEDEERARREIREDVEREVVEYLRARASMGHLTERATGDNRAYEIELGLHRKGAPAAREPAPASDPRELEMYEARERARHGEQNLLQRISERQAGVDRLQARVAELESERDTIDGARILNLAALRNMTVERDRLRAALDREIDLGNECSTIRGHALWLLEGLRDGGREITERDMEHHCELIQEALGPDRKAT